MTEFSKRVVFTMGGKGGVGKTGVAVALAEWFQVNEIPVTLLDLDTENKARGSLKHFFNGTVTKVDVHTPAGLDAFVDHLDGGTPIILADMGAGAGQVAAGYVALEIRATTTLQKLLTHLYVLIPVLDNEKHYWVGEDEIEKLLKRGEGWLGAHPEKELIVARYLKRQRTLNRCPGRAPGRHLSPALRSAPPCSGGKYHLPQVKAC